MNILFVEDEDDARIGLVALLRSLGHNVDEAVDGDQAVEQLQQKAYGLVLLDVMLPPGENLAGVPFRETGKELLVRLRAGLLGQLQTSAQVPVVAFTAVSDIDVIAAINGRASRVLFKPIDPEDAVVEIRNLLEEVNP